MSKHNAEVAENSGKAPLTREALVAAAAELARNDGLDAITIRRVAAKVGASPMSLYRFVAGKEQLLDLMVDDALAPLPYLSSEGPWRDELRRFFTALYDLLVESPAAAHHLIDSVTRARELLLRGASIHHCLERNGVSQELAAEMTDTMSWFTIGGALHNVARKTHIEEPTRLEFQRHLRHHERLTPEERRAHFLDGLEYLLDGYDRRITRAGSGDEPRPHEARPSIKSARRALAKRVSKIVASD